MDMRNIIKRLDEIENNVSISVEEMDDQDSSKIHEAMFWVQRYISGSMTDPDWDEQWLQFFKQPLQAFRWLSRSIKIKNDYHSLYRGLDKTQISSGKLLPHKLFPFQSFTTDLNVAKEFMNKRDNSIIIELQPPKKSILFSYNDLLQSKNYIIKDYMNALSDWEYQNEVLLEITQPVPIQIVNNNNDTD